MSTKENKQEEEIKDSENNPQVNENQDIVAKLRYSFCISGFRVYKRRFKTIFV